jgi:hypothetical protein
LLPLRVLVVVVGGRPYLPRGRGVSLASADLDNALEQHFVLAVDLEVLGAAVKLVVKLPEFGEPQTLVLDFVAGSVLPALDLPELAEVGLVVSSAVDQLNDVHYKGC